MMITVRKLGPLGIIALALTAIPSGPHVISLPGLTMKVPRAWRVLAFHGVGFDFIGDAGVPNPCTFTPTSTACDALPALDPSQFVVALKVPQAPLMDSAEGPPVLPSSGERWVVDRHQARWDTGPQWLGPNQPDITAAIEWGGPKNWLQISLAAGSGHVHLLEAELRQALRTLRFSTRSAPANFAPVLPIG